MRILCYPLLFLCLLTVGDVEKSVPDKNAGNSVLACKKSGKHNHRLRRARRASANLDGSQETDSIKITIDNPNKSILTSDLNGKITTNENMERTFVYAVLQRLYDGYTWIAGSGKPKPIRNDKTSWAWDVHGIKFPERDFDQGYKIGAVLMNNGQDELPIGVTDYETLKRHASAYTDFITLAQPRIDCHVSITEILDINGNYRSVDNDFKEPTEVSLNIDVRGQFDGPEGSYARLVVNAINDDQKWIQIPKGTTDKRDWSETAYIGVEGKDVGGLFRLQAFVFKDFVPLKRTYKEPEWSNLKNAHTCASSPEVTVKRRVSAKDLVIQEIGGDKAPRGDNDTPMSLDQLVCSINGGIEVSDKGNALLPNESVWILRSPQKTASQWIGQETAGQWTVVALALMSEDKLGWKVPDFHFPNPGVYKVMAVVAQKGKLKREQTLSEADWENLIASGSIKRLSTAVTVNVGQEASEAPPLSGKSNTAPH